MGENARQDGLADLQRRLRDFADERDWGQFHTPKNLAMAATVEAGELLEIFQWLTPTESASLGAEDLQRVRDELADVMIYLLRLGDVLAIDIARSIDEKIVANARRYPTSLARGNARKHHVAVEDG